MSKLFKQFKKLNRADIDELIKRSEQINSFILVVQGLETQKALWLNGKMKQLGLDTEKRYNIDFKTGTLIPVVEVPPPNPTEDLTKVLPSK